MNKTVKPVFSFVGSSGSGKTTFLEQLIPILVIKGCRVGLIKHDAHKFQIDKPGKDSYRLKEAGAETVSINSDDKLAIVQSHDGSYSIEDIILKFFGDMDIILTEGYKKSDIPKFEIYRENNGKPPVAAHRKELIGVITDSNGIFDNGKRFHINDYEGVADFIMEISDFSVPSTEISGIDEKYLRPLEEYSKALAKCKGCNNIKIKIEIG